MNMTEWLRQREQEQPGFAERIWARHERSITNETDEVIAKALTGYAQVRGDNIEITAGAWKSFRHELGLVAFRRAKRDEGQALSEAFPIDLRVCVDTWMGDLRHLSETLSCLCHALKEWISLQKASMPAQGQDHQDSAPRLIDC